MKHNQPVKKSQFGENFGCYRNIIVAAQAADAADSYLLFVLFCTLVWEAIVINPGYQFLSSIQKSQVKQCNGNRFYVVIFHRS